MILTAALALGACNGDVEVTAPPMPDITPGPGTGAQYLQISGTLTAEGCLEATILYDGQELAGARAVCGTKFGGCARLHLRAASIPRTDGHHTIAFQVIRQSSPVLDYQAEGEVRVEMDGGMVMSVPLGPTWETLRTGESVSFEIDLQ